MERLDGFHDRSQPQVLQDNIKEIEDFQRVLNLPQRKDQFGF
jgi:hypothetical protein